MMKQTFVNGVQITTEFDAMIAARWQHWSHGMHDSLTWILLFQYRFRGSIEMCILLLLLLLLLFLSIIFIIIIFNPRKTRVGKIKKNTKKFEVEKSRLSYYYYYYYYYYIILMRLLLYTFITPHRQKDTV